MNYHEVRRGDIYYADLGGGIGSEQMGTRPVAVLQNDIGNTFSSTVIVATMTKSIREFPTHFIIGPECGLKCKSVIQLEQLRTVDKKGCATESDIYRRMSWTKSWKSLMSVLGEKQKRRGRRSRDGGNIWLQLV